MKKISLLLLLGIAPFIFGQKVLTIDNLLTLNRMGGGIPSPDGTNVLFTLSKANIEENKLFTDVYIYNLKTKNYLPISSDKSITRFDFQWTKDQTIWYVSNENKEDGMQVWNMDVKGQNKKQITKEKDGVSGFKISQDGSLLVLIVDQKIEKSINDIYPTLKESKVKMYDDLMYRHWSYWNDDKYKQLYYYHLKNKETTGTKVAIAQIDATDKVTPPFTGSEAIAISVDNKTIYYSYKNKKGTEFALSTNTDIYAYDVASNTTENLSADNKGYDNNPVVSSDGKYLAWTQMKRDGYEADKNDLVLYDFKTKTATNITEKHDITVSDFTFGDGKIYLTIPHRGCEQIFELDLKTNKLTQLTSTTADYVGISYVKGSLIALRQSMIAPIDMYQLDLKTKNVTQLTAVNDEYLSTIEKPTVKETWIKTKDGKDMLVWHILPPNFDSTKTYPTLLYAQGGPQSMVSQFFSYRWNFMIMASKGYVIVAPNRRGLPGFGTDWNEAISKDWAGKPMDDYLAAADDAMTKPYVDKDRMGAIGASYGGYSVYYLAGIHENRFKTFISHCGLFNLDSWYLTTEELFFANWDNYGPYWLPENKAYYEKTSPHKLVQNWNTPMMVIHGELDFRVPLEQGLQAFQAAKLRGLDAKLLLFENEGHWVSSPQNAVIWQTEFFNWLNKYLGGSK